MDNSEYFEDEDNLRFIHYIPRKHFLNADWSHSIGPQNTSVSGQCHSWYESVVHKEEDADDNVSCLEEKPDVSEREQESGVYSVDLSEDLVNSNCEAEFVVPESKEDKDTKNDIGDDYKCPHCHVKFKRKVALKTHVSNHLEVRDCKECNYRAENKIDLEAHLLDEHSFVRPSRLKSVKRTFSGKFLKGKFYQCSECPYKSDRKWNVTSHLRRHSKLGSSQKGNFKSLNLLTRKAPSHINHFLKLEESPHTSLEKGYNPIISKISSTSSSLTIFNENQVVNDGQIRTSTSFLNTSILREIQSCSASASSHTTTNFDHNDINIVNDFSITSEKDETKIDSYPDLEKPILLKCIECPFTTTEHFLLKEHISNHPGMKLFNCAKCNFSTNFEQHFNDHIFDHSSDEVFKYSRSDIVTNHKSFLHDHTLNQDPSTEFKCDHCPFATPIYRSLKAHQIIHSNERIFKCTECDYESNVEKYLKTHSLVHCPEEQQYKCLKCNYKTPRKGQLKIHSLKHTNIKLYSCPTCNFKTNRRCSLKVHSLSHSTKKLFKCSICSYETNQKLLLRLHILNHLNIKLHKCPHCDYATNHSSHFKRHFQKHV